MLRDKLEPKIDTVVEKRLCDPSFLSPIISSYMEQQTSNLEPSQEVVRDRLDALEKKRSRVLESFFDGAITKDERDSALEAVQAEVAAFTKITPLRRNPHLNQEHIIEAVSVFKEWQFLNHKQKRRLLDQLVPEIFVYQYNIRGLTLRFDGENASPWKRVKSPSVGQPVL